MFFFNKYMTGYVFFLLKIYETGGVLNVSAARTYSLYLKKVTDDKSFG